MQLSRKSKDMDEFLDNAAETLFGIKRVDAIEGDFCIICKQPATTFRDILSRKEFSISGMCQSCQDETFDE